MKQEPMPQTDALSPSTCLRIDRICTRFEQSWLEGRRPNIHDHLTEFDGVECDVLLRELLLLDIYHRRRLGESPIPEEYRERFPRLESQWLLEALAEGDKQHGETTHDNFSVSKQTASAPKIRYFGDYELLEEIAQGGMGQVCKARQISLNRNVAIKMIRDGELASPQELARFRQEAESAANLDHPNIVPIYEIGQCEGQHYFSMKLIEGGSLSQRKADVGLTAKLSRGEARRRQREIARLLATVAQAVHHAHQRGILHRDLKPANILLDSAGQPHVTDFGLAKKLEGDSGITQSGAIIGTPSYMAPEQTNGVKALTTQTDVYGLGAVLYELLTGNAPFKADNILDTIIQVRHQEPIPPSVVNVNVDRDLETICLKCLEKDPGRRYGSAEALKFDLDRWVNGEAIAARPAGRIERGRRWCRRNPLAASLLAAVVMVLLLGTTVAILFAIESHWNAQLAETKTKEAQDNLDIAKEEENRANEKAIEARDNEQKALRREKEAEDARKQAENETTRAEKALTRAEWLVYSSRLLLAQQQWSDGDVRQARATLDSCRWDFRHIEYRYLYSLFHSSQKIFRGHTARVSSVAFNNDGKMIASSSADGSVRIWNVETGKEIRSLTFTTYQTVNTLAFSPNGKKIACGTNNNGPVGGLVNVWDVETGRELFSNRRHTWSVNSVVFSNDGKRLVSAGNREVIAWDADKGKELLRFEADSNCVLFTPDGNQILSAGADRSINVWDAQAGNLIRKIRSETGMVFSIAVSPDGGRVATANWEPNNPTSPGAVHVWDLESGRIKLSFKGHSARVNSVAFSPDGKKIASAGENSPIKVWDAQTGEEIATLLGHTGAVTSVAFDRDGSRLVSGSADKLALVWNLKQKQHITTLPKQIKEVNAVAGDAAGKIVVVAGKGANVQVWDTESNVLKHSLTGHISDVNSVAVSRDGKTIVSGGADGRVLVYNTETGKTVVSLKGHTDAVHAVAISPDGKTVISGSADTTVKVWDVARESTFHSLQGHTAAVNGVSISDDGKKVVSGGTDRRVCVWDVEFGKKLFTSRDQSGKVNSVAIDSTGNLVASAGADKTIKMWNVHSGEFLFTLAGHEDAVSSVTFSHDGKRVVSGSIDRTVRVWNTETGQETLNFKAHTNAVRGVALDRSNTMIISGGDDRTVKLWNVDSTAETCTLVDHLRWVTSVGVSLDGSRLVSGGYDETVKVWNANTGQLVASLNGHSGCVTSVAISPDGKKVVSGSWDKTVKIWDADNAREIRTLTGHSEEVNSVAFSRDGKTIVSAGNDRLVKLWNAETGEELRTLQDHTKKVTAVAFSPDNRFVISGGADKTVLWSVETGETLFSQINIAPVAALTFAPDGKRIAIAIGTIVWMRNSPTGNTIPFLRGHTAEVTGVGFSNDGKWMISSSKDGTARIWNAETGKEILQMRNHTAEVTGAAFYPTGTKVISGSHDHTVKVTLFDPRVVAKAP